MTMSKENGIGVRRLGRYTTAAIIKIAPARP